MTVLGRDFFLRPTLDVARDLLGCRLVREYDGRRLSGAVAETEAYLGGKDSASHAFRGRTRRNLPLFGPAGVAYVYFVYGMHHMLNVVTEDENTPCAVLLRAIVPLEGMQVMSALRGRPGPHLADGPARLCRALAIDRSLNGWDLTAGRELWFESYRRIPDESVLTGPRVGIDYAAESDRKAPWRMRVSDGFSFRQSG